MFLVCYNTDKSFKRQDMAKKKKELSDAEREELETYCQDEFYYDIYEELTDKDDENFELSFFGYFVFRLEKLNGIRQNP